MPLSGLHHKLLVAAMLSGAACAGWRVSQQEPWPTGFATVDTRAAGLAAGPAATDTAASRALPASDATPATTPAAMPAAAEPQAHRVSGQAGAAVHAASIVMLADGRLRAAWFSGSREGAPDVEIRTATFDTVSQRWSAEATALTREQVMRGLARRVKKLGNPVLARAGDGRLHLYVVTVSLGGWAGSAVTRFVSDDEGSRWHSPRRLVTSPFLNISTLVKGRPVTYADGSTGLPAYHELVHKHAEWLRLDAEGRVLDRVRLPGGSGSLQPVVLPLDATHAEIVMRHAVESGPSAPLARITRSQTLDAGRTWQPVQAASLPNPNAAVAALASTGGPLWMVFNDSETDRGNLALAWAARPRPGEAPVWQRAAVLDGGTAAVRPAQSDAARYRKELLQEIPDRAGLAAQAPAVVDAAARQLCFAAPGGERCNREYSYPSLAEDAAGNLHLVYTWHRAAIKHLVLPRAWLDARRVVDTGAAR